MTRYELTPGGMIRRLADGAVIPRDDRNGEYRDYLDYVSAGGDEALLPAPTLAEARAAKVEAINAQRDLVLAAGAPYGPARIAVHDGARADLSGMAAYATTVLITAATPAPIAWPDSYALGWIAVDNNRVPLPTAADGLALAAAVGAWYGAVVQHARNLKDEALAAPDVAALDAVDPAAGWP
ncbi:MAG: hypothetical protein J0H82_06300 [Alphaproteobacteria bacterium]|jgi:hypothetical protein|nr:hypothetical protein [Alphaproteobacteria bacterium]